MPRFLFKPAKQLQITTPTPHEFKKGDQIFVLDRRMWIVSVPTPTTLNIREWRWFDWFAWAWWQYRKQPLIVGSFIDLCLISLILCLYFSFN